MRHNTSGIFMHKAANIIKSILNSSVLLLPFILLTERWTECQYWWQVMAVFCEMENIVGSSSQNMFSPWSQSWLHLSLSSCDFKVKTPHKQFCVLQLLSGAPVSPPTYCPPSSQPEAFLCHPLFNKHRSCTSLTSISVLTVCRDSLVTRPCLSSMRHH